MGTLSYERETYARVERLVDLLELRSDWNSGTFDGTIYEHALPVFEAAYRHFLKPLTRATEEFERRRLERAIHEVFGAHSRGFQLTPAHNRMMDLVRDYLVYGRTLEYPLSEWTTDELFKEYDYSYYQSQFWGVVSLAIAATDVSAAIATAAAAFLGAARVAVVAGGVGTAMTALGAIAATLTYYHFTGERDAIREEVQNRIEDGRLTSESWDEFDLSVRRRYNG